MHVRINLLWPGREIPCWLFLPAFCQCQISLCWVTSRRSSHQKGLIWLRICSARQALGSPLLPECGNPDPSTPRCLWVSRAGSPAREMVCLGSVGGDLTQICLGFGSWTQLAITTALEQCDLGDFESTKEFAGTQLFWLYRHLFDTTLQSGAERALPALETSNSLTVNAGMCGHGYPLWNCLLGRLGFGGFGGVPCDTMDTLSLKCILVRKAQL